MQLALRRCSRCKRTERCSVKPRPSKPCFSTHPKDQINVRILSLRVPSTQRWSIFCIRTRNYGFGYILHIWVLGPLGYCLATRLAWRRCRILLRMWSCGPCFLELLGTPFYTTPPSQNKVQIGLKQALFGPCFGMEVVQKGVPLKPTTGPLWTSEPSNSDLPS